MSWLDVVTVILAAWGAILATILGVKEMRRESRKIKIILEHIDFYETCQIRIINIGHRPITIAEISLDVPVDEKRKNWDSAPANVLIDTEDPEFRPLPITIDDGKQIVIKFSKVVGSVILEKNMNVRLFVYDIEGKVYKKFQKLHYNPKWGHYYPAK